MGKLPPTITVTAPPEATYPGEILKAVAAQIAPLTGGALRGEVWSAQLQGALATYDLNAAATVKGPSSGLFRVDHALAKPYPVYVSARCFGDVWPPPPLGPSD